MRSALWTILQFSESIDMKDILLRRRNLLLCNKEFRAVCFEADGEQTVAITKVGSAPAITMQYSYDEVTWDDWDLTALPFGGDTKVYVRGVGNARFGIDGSNHNRFTFGTDAFVYVSGIVESLLDGDDKVLNYNVSGILRNLFCKQTALRSAEGLRFEAMTSSTEAVSAYALMFQGCTNLLYAPKVLPTSNFRGQYTYQYMFDGCSSLLTAPELPSTALQPRCYQYMFRNCTSLVDAPELPATKLANYCYQYMFYGCTSLKTIRCRAKQTGVQSTVQWLGKVATNGTFYGYSEYGWASGTGEIPTGWEFVELTD